MWYPREVFTPREDVTRENMRKYEERQNKFYDTALSLYPDFLQRPFLERLQLREEIEAAMKK